MTQLARRTTVYVDGYNLYYGRLRGTANKRLDLVALFDRLLHEQDPATQVRRVRYFTAPVRSGFARHGDASMVAQQAYHRALERLYPDRLSIILGDHAWDRNGTVLPAYEPGRPFDRSKVHRVWRIEEKLTDVNLALAIYRDVAKGEVDQVVVCSNDRDVEPALTALREDFPTVRIGVVTPAHPPAEAGRDSQRRVSTSLAKHADWVRQHLREEELAASQLPLMVPTAKKPIRKPEHW